MMHVVDHVSEKMPQTDIEWNKLNASDFRYGVIRDGLLFSDRLLSGVLDGFVSLYSKTAMVEDRAEVFGAMSYGYNELMQKVGTNNPILKNKIEFIKSLTKTKDEFWKSRELDSRNGFYERCLRSETESECKTSHVFLKPHSDWKQ